jgi:phage baseplate assembly protein W
MTTPDPFGRGFLVADGDLVLEDGRLAEVAGIRNLVQALTLRILTPFGSDRFDPNYGLDVKEAFTAPGSTRIVKELLKLNLVGTLTADPRVSAVRRVTFDDDPDRLATDPDGARAARVRRKWTVVVELETATGATATLLANVEVGRS